MRGQRSAMFTFRPTLSIDCFTQCVVSRGLPVWLAFLPVCCHMCHKRIGGRTSEVHRVPPGCNADNARDARNGREDGCEGACGKGDRGTEGEHMAPS